MKTTNLQLQQDVCEELQYEPSVDASGIGVAAKDGIVTLTGAVKSYAEKISAARTAERVRGVRAVADEIQVQLPERHVRSDEDIAQAVLNALKWDVVVPDDRVKVKVEHGLITLDGTVDYNYQQIAAVNAIRNLAGVKGVHNHITVQPLVSPSQVKTKIENAFRRTAELNAQAIKVSVSGTKVMLNGTVRTWSERTEAERAAWAAPGVTQVEDNLTVAA